MTKRPMNHEAEAETYDPEAEYRITVSRYVEHGGTPLRPGMGEIRMTGAAILAMPAEDIAAIATAEKIERAKVG